MSEKEIHLAYFALLREERGQAGETLHTAAATPRALYQELRGRHGFSLEEEQMKPVINDAFSSWDTALQPGDRVVFIPPVAGG